MSKREDAIFILSILMSFALTFPVHGWFADRYYTSYENYQRNNDWIKILCMFIMAGFFGFSYLMLSFLFPERPTQTTLTSFLN